MVRERTTIVSIERAASENEISAMEAIENRKIRRPHFVSEPIGQILGIEALYPENDLRELLVLDLEEKLAAFKKLRIGEMSYDELRHWTKWVTSIEKTLDRVTSTIAAGQALLAPQNLGMLLRTISMPADQVAFRDFLTRLADK
jgi:hypothetical protein